MVYFIFFLSFCFVARIQLITDAKSLEVEDAVVQQYIEPVNALFIIRMIYDKDG